MKKTFSYEVNNERKIMMRSLIIPLFFITCIVLVFFLQLQCSKITTLLALYPRDFKHLVGILTMTFVHQGWSHLIHNAVTLFFLSVILFYLFRVNALSIFLKMWFLSGALLWLVGRQSYHIGASGLIFSIAFFLFVSGLLRKNRNMLALSLTMVFLYGGMIWQIFPWEATLKISWEGHLCGALVGCLLAFFYRKAPPIEDTNGEIEDELDESNPYWEVNDEENNN